MHQEGYGYAPDDEGASIIQWWEYHEVLWEYVPRGMMYIYHHPGEKWERVSRRSRSMIKWNQANNGRKVAFAGQLNESLPGIKWNMIKGLTKTSRWSKCRILQMNSTGGKRITNRFLQELAERDVKEIGEWSYWVKWMVDPFYLRFERYAPNISNWLVNIWEWLQEKQLGQI